MKMLLILCVSVLLVLKSSDAVTGEDALRCEKVDYFEFGAMFYQNRTPAGEYLFDYKGNEMFHVDLDTKSVVWTLPDLEKYTSYDVQGGLQNINVAKFNLDVMMKNSNYTAATNIPPMASVYTENPVVMGEPNTLICFIRNIFPPVMNTTWLKNGEKITEGMKESLFLPSQDHSFRKFLYLVFVPNDNDIYTCDVEHWGLEKPQRVMWQPDVQTPPSEAYQNVVCALGLAVGIIGIIAGVLLIIKGMKQRSQ